MRDLGILSFASIAALILLTTAVIAQSSVMDTATPLTSNTIEGEGDGKGETVYYSFTALKGDLKVTADAKTDYYSTPLRITLLDEDGGELLPLYVVATDAGKREVATRRFVRQTKVVIRITTQNDKAVKLLSYKIRLDGSVQFEIAAAPAAEPGAQSQPTIPADASAAQPASSTESGATPTPPSGEVAPSPPPAEQTGAPKTKNKIKKKAKDAAKKAIDGFLDN